MCLAELPDPDVQAAVIRRLQRRLTEAERALRDERLRADFASARADGLEEQHTRLLEALPALGAVLDAPRPRPRLLTRLGRLLANGGSRGS